MTEGYNDRLRSYIEAAIYDQAPTWESLFDSGPGQVVSVSDAALVAAMAASRFRLLYEQDPSRCPDCGNPGDVCFCEKTPRHDSDVQHAAALDYAETALSECWTVLQRIRAGEFDPRRIAGDLLEAHGFVS